jgi:epoxyqueuosine reductase
VRAPVSVTGKALREKARELGFDKVGAARAGPAPRAESFRERLEGGLAGALPFLGKDVSRRLDPALVLPGARSVLCVAMNYFVPGRPEEDPARGRLSRYAWGGDYHGILLDRLKALARFIEGAGGRARVFVDSGPVPEKPWAERAGLGWEGKHTILLSRDFGSWLFLGEVITDLELDPDPPFAKDYCGTCTRCLDRCPTGAIAAPRRLEARRCLSWLTVEHRGPVPRDLRPLLGNRIFGCDACQECCPWNRFARPSGAAEFGPREEASSLADLLRLAPEEFRLRFRGTPVRRAGYAGFLRNVAVAAGNSRDPRAVPALEAALGHPEPLVRGHAAWALGRLGARGALERRRGAEADPAAREEIEDALSGASGPAG